MKISAVKSVSPNFKNVWANKTLLKGLETVSNHGASFVAATSLVMAGGIRPLSIALTPNIKKENKQHAIAHSVTSALTKFAIVEAIALPVENAVKKIDKNPEKYLKNNTINTFKNSEGYNFATQIIKQGTGLISAIPKAVITVALIPVVMGIFFGNKQKKKENETFNIYNQPSEIFEKFNNNGNTPSFKGILTETTAKGIGKILNNNTVQQFASKHAGQSTNIARNIAIATDILLSASFAHRTMKSKKIKEENKKPLVYNSLISTGISVAGGYTIDKAVQKGTKKFIDKFSEINKNDPNLNKYIQGINIIRPTLIFAGIYYGLLPVISTYIADKLPNKTEKS